MSFLRKQGQFSEILNIISEEAGTIFNDVGNSVWGSRNDLGFKTWGFGTENFRVPSSTKTIFSGLEISFPGSRDEFEQSWKSFLRKEGRFCKIMGFVPASWKMNFQAKLAEVEWAKTQGREGKKRQSADPADPPDPAERSHRRQDKPRQPRMLSGWRS